MPFTLILALSPCASFNHLEQLCKSLSKQTFWFNVYIWPKLSARLLARILKVGVQLLKAHIAWRRRRHAPRGVWGHAPPENFEKLKPHRPDFRDSDSCKRLSINLLNRSFSLIILLSYPFFNFPCLTLNYIWDRNSSCYEE